MSHLTSTGRAWGLPVADERAGFHLGGQGWPQVQRFLIEPIQAALGLEGGKVSGGMSFLEDTFLLRWDLDPCS